MPETLGKKISELRKKSGLGTQRQAAPLLGVVTNTLCNYENDKTLPDIDFLARLTRLTGARFLELLRLRLAAAGFEFEEVLSVRDAAGTYTTGASAAPSDISAVRRVVQSAAVPLGWALLIVQLAASGDITLAGAQAVIDYLEQKEEGDS